MTKGFDYHLAMYANSHMSRAGAKLLCNKLSIEYNNDPSEENFAAWSRYIVHHLRTRHTDKELAGIVINHLPLMANRMLFMEIDSSCSTFISGVINDADINCNKRIQKLLRQVFNHDNIARFLSQNAFVSESLPDKSLNSDDYFYHIATLLIQHGSINSRFFSLLIRERPLQKINLIRAADYFGIAREDIISNSTIEADESTTPHHNHSSSTTLIEKSQLSRNCRTREDLSKFLQPEAIIEGSHYRFKVQSRIYTGQIGEVWTALDLNSQRHKTVALKVISIPQQSQAGYAVQSWLRSVEAIRTLQGISGIIRPLTGVELWNGVVYYALPYYSRGTLHDAVVNRSADVYALLNGLVGIVKALSTAHQKFILHRDISPRNILLNDQLDMVITDWENSAVSTYDLRDTKIEFLGTEGFAAPEIRTECNALPDVRSDIYSIAQTMIFCFIGTNPILGNRRVALEKVCYNFNLIDVLCRASDLVADNRFSSMTEFHSALLNALQSHTTIPNHAFHTNITNPASISEQRESDLTLRVPHVNLQTEELSDSPFSLHTTIYWAVASMAIALMACVMFVLRMVLW